MNEVKEAQALRYKVFAEELGARLPFNSEDLDIDEFDKVYKFINDYSEKNNLSEKNIEKLSKFQKTSLKNLHNSWISIPHVTHSNCICI